MKKVDYCKIYSPIPNNRGKGLLNKRWGYLTDNLNINKWGVQIRGGDLKNLGQMWHTITLNKTRNAIQSNFTITQSRIIQIYIFETSLIQL